MQNEKRGYDGCFFTKVKSPFRTKDHEIAIHDGDLKLPKVLIPQYVVTF